jgi:hypothetical protein
MRHGSSKQGRPLIPSHRHDDIDPAKLLWAMTTSSRPGKSIHIPGDGGQFVAVHQWRSWPFTTGRLFRADVANGALRTWITPPSRS